MYDVRAINTKSPLQLSYKANVFQATGEEWKNVKLTLSTANPNLSGLKPELVTQYLDFFQPMINYNRRAKSMPMDAKREDVGPAAAELEIAESSASLVTTLETAVNTEFAISLPYNVPSSNKPTLVEIDRKSVV